MSSDKYNIVRDRNHFDQIRNSDKTIVNNVGDWKDEAMEDSDEEF